MKDISSDNAIIGGMKLIRTTRCPYAPRGGIFLSPPGRRKKAGKRARNLVIGLKKDAARYVRGMTPPQDEVPAYDLYRPVGKQGIRYPDTGRF